VKRGRRKVFGVGVGVWAFLLSLGVHAILFTVFSFVNVSGGVSKSGALEPAVVSVAQIQNTLSQTPTLPKPKVKRIDHGKASGKRALELDAWQREKVEYSQGDISEISEQLEGGLLAGQFETSPATEFFGSTTHLRKICYVVDASGSMQGRLGMVRRNLKGSLAKLEADQYFYVIFFRGDGLVESGNGLLARASSRAKTKAYEFIDGIRFEGPTNAVNAIERAMMIRDSSGQSVQQIYFLSDGFDFTGDDSTDFASMIKKMRKRLAPAVRINTIGVWVEQQDEEILREIAAGSGGGYVGLE
jgi:hypothetical protein